MWKNYKKHNYFSKEKIIVTNINFEITSYQFRKYRILISEILVKDMGSTIKCYIAQESLLLFPTFLLAK